MGDIGLDKHETRIARAREVPRPPPRDRRPPRLPPDPPGRARAARGPHRHLPPSWATSPSRPPS